ncbi:MAG: glycosyltransferase family 39 protein [Acidobacteriaceae bacterium]|nr:glycosyltransferase family 39 protein [Acidobacteriaceae bacterium]
MNALLNRARDPGLHFRVAVAIVVLVTFVHISALPLIVSWDGMQYIHLANVLSGPDVISHWDFYRTPLFPLALNMMFWLGGEQPHAALLLVSLLGLGGVLLMGLIVRRLAGQTSGAIALVVLAFYPILVGYQHTLLTETGAFFSIALLLWSVVCVAPIWKRNPITVAFWISFVIAVGYYWRPTLLMLSPVAAVLFVLIMRLPSEGPKPYFHLMQQLRGQDRRVVAGGLIIALSPWLLAYPWKHLTDEYKPDAYAPFFAEGIFRQVLVPPSDPILASVKTEYEAAIKEYSVNGHLRMDGVAVASQSQLKFKFHDIFQHTSFLGLIRKYPFRYIAGVTRSIIFFLGLRANPSDDENFAFSHYVFVLWPSGDSFDHTLGWDAGLVEFTSIGEYGGGAVFGRVLHSLIRVYAWTVFASSLLTVFWLVMSLIQGNAVGVALTSLPLTFLGLHAVALETLNRYGFPVYPLMLVNTLIFLSVLLKAFWRKRWDAVARASDSPVASRASVQ